LVAESQRGLIVLKRISVVHVLAQLLEQIADPQAKDYSFTHSNSLNKNFLIKSPNS